jgi:hypothetical protein
MQLLDESAIYSNLYVYFFELNEFSKISEPHTA